MESFEVVVFPAKGKVFKETIQKGHELPSLQRLVGGLIEPVNLHNQYGQTSLTRLLSAFGACTERPLGLVNEEGHLHNMRKNPHFPAFVGTVVVISDKHFK